jgi:hypothetical protein
LEAALFPAGAADPLDPASFHALHAAATSLVARLQGAYAVRARELAAARRELAVQADKDKHLDGDGDEDGDEDERVAHLRCQLDEACAALARREDELADERRRRLELESARGSELEVGAWARRRGSDSGFESASESGSSPVFEPVDSEKRGRGERDGFGSGAGWSEVEMLRMRVGELEEAVEDAMRLIQVMRV